MKNGIQVAEVDRGVDDPQVQRVRQVRPARGHEPQPDRDRERQDQLRPPAQPERAPLDELRVVVGEADQRTRYGHAEDADRAPVVVRQQQERHRDRGEDDDPAHRRRARLGVMALGAFLADRLTELALAQERDELRRQEDADEQRGGARDQDLTHRARASATVSSPIPRDAFTSTTSPGPHQPGDAAKPPRRRRRPRATRPRTTRGTRRDSGPTATRTSTPVDAAYAPISRCASTSPAPSSSMSPSTATRRPPKALA